MMLGVWRGQIIKAAVDADVFTKLQGRSLAAAEIAKECKMNLKKPEEFFNVLVSVKLLKKDGKHKYSLNDISSRYLSRD